MQRDVLPKPIERDLDSIQFVAGIAARFQGRSLEFRLKDVLDDKGRGRGAIEATMAVHRTFWNLR